MNYFFQAVSITEEEIKKQEEKVIAARMKLKEALKNIYA